MSSYAIDGRSLVKTYQTGDTKLQVLNGVDLQVEQGEFVSIQGESGCGKTTLLNLLSGLEMPDSGSVNWRELTISQMGRNELARRRAAYIGIVFQSYYLVPEITALQNVLMSLRIAKRSINASDFEQARAMLERVGLGDRFDQMPSTLSGGERQRVAIARALLARPQVVLADEPTGNLDERTGNSVMDLLQELCHEFSAALVLVTHNADHAARAARQLSLTKGTFDE